LSEVLGGDRPTQPCQLIVSDEDRERLVAGLTSAEPFVQDDKQHVCGLDVWLVETVPPGNAMLRTTARRSTLETIHTDESDALVGYCAIEVFKLAELLSATASPPSSEESSTS
jgi:hypothetical protein